MAAGQAPWYPDVTVATVVVRAGKLLVVEEYAGSDRLQLNQPAGHLDPDETLAQAAVRETLEETGWDVELTGFIGAYQWTAPSGQEFLRFAFFGEPLRHHPQRRLDDGIERAIWMTPTELQAQADRHRSPLVWKVVQDYLAGQRYPLSLVQAVA